MPTLAETALSCAEQLGRADGASILDLESEIKGQIGEAIRHHNRKPWHLTETREIVLTTAADQAWYSTVSVASAEGDQTYSGTRDVNDILQIDYIREDLTSLSNGLKKIPYQEFERLNEGSPTGGTPWAYTRYSGQIGIYPTPSGVYTITFSAHMKGAVPVSDSDTSVWLDQAGELIEAAACKRVALKYLRDRERSLEFAAIEQEALDAFMAEHRRKTSTGRVKVHC